MICPRLSPLLHPDATRDNRRTLQLRRLFTSSSPPYGYREAKKHGVGDISHDGAIGRGKDSMRFIMALALLWMTQLQAAPSLLKEAGIAGGARSRRLSAAPRRQSPAGYGTVLRQVPGPGSPWPLSPGTARQCLSPRSGNAQQETLRLLDFRLQQIAPDPGCRYAGSGARAAHPALASGPASPPGRSREWHALNGPRLYLYPADERGDPSPRPPITSSRKSRVPSSPPCSAAVC